MRRTRKSARPALRWSVAVQPTLLFGSAGGARRPIYLDEVMFGFGDDPDPSDPVFNASVEAWRDDVRNAAGTLPVNFLLAWIQKESNGNPCSWTRLSEAGIMQLMAGDNIAQGQTTLAEQHPVPPCVSGAQTTAYRSSLTDEQASWQVTGGINYVNYCRRTAEALLGANGYLGQPGWTDSDWSYWAAVKMIHVAPAKLAPMLQQGSAGYGGVPPDWDAMMQYVTGVPSSWTDNARWVGQYGEGGGSLVTALTSTKVLGFVLIGGGALALLYLAKKNRLVGV